MKHAATRVTKAVMAAAIVFVGIDSDAAESQAYRVLHTYALGGEGGWDFLSFDAESRRLFITRDSHVMVVDPDTGKLLGDIEGTKDAHGVAFAPALNRGFISNGHGDNVTAFGLDSLHVIGDFPVTGKDPDPILFDAASHRVFTFNGHSNNISVLDPMSGNVVATVPAPGRPEFAVSDGKGRIYFNVEDKAKVAVLDSNANRLLATWSLGACEGPTGLAIDFTHNRVFSACANRQLVVLDATEGHLVATLPIGDHPDAAVYDATVGNLFTSNGEGTLTVIHQDDADHYSVIATVATAVRSKTMALDPKTHHIFLAAAKFGAVPPKTKAEQRPKGPMLPGSFYLIEVGAP
jgi:YVTN family beta-propeller protein